MEKVPLTKRRQAAILATDVVEYSRMMEADQAATIGLIRELRETRLEPVVSRHGGEVLKRMGDGWIIAFSGVDAALDCAIEAQEGLAGHPKTRLRMGIHCGEIVEDADDFYGASVNLAVRLQTEAPPGGVMISSEVHQLLPAARAEMFANVGALRLKNIAQPVSGFQWRPGGQRVAGGQRSDEVPMISVEEFAATPDDSETRSAAADLREQIILSLSRRIGVRVRDAGLGQSQNATYALRGRLRHSAAKARLNLTLVLKSDGSNIWAGAFDGDATDLFAFCDDVAMRADTELRLQFNVLDGDRIADLPDDVLSSAELRARAASLFYQGNLKSLRKCKALMDRALRLNADDPMAMVMRAEAVIYLSAVGHTTVEVDELDRLVADIDRAVEMSPRIDYFYFVRAELRAYVLGDAQGALADSQRCLKINPGYAPLYETTGLAHLLAGRFDQARAAFARSVAMLPTDPFASYRTYYREIARFCYGDALGVVENMHELIAVKPSVRAYRKLLVLALRAVGDDAGAEREDAAAIHLPDEPNFHAPRPPLPDDYRWLVEALAPGRT